MAPSRPAPSIVVRTPRHASRRLRPSVAAEIRRLAKERDGAEIALDEKGLASDPGHPLGVASDNASEWNSLLITARAERGPQWDVATQRFMVDYGSHLYYDTTSLTLSEEHTPPPEDPLQPQDTVPQAQWPNDLRYAQFSGAAMPGAQSLMNSQTPARTSLRLQQQQQQALAQAQNPLNGHALGNGMASPHQYHYQLPNGRQQHFEPGQSFYDTAGQTHPANPAPGLTNGMMGNPMMARQNSMAMAMGGNLNMSMGNMGMGLSPMGMGNMDFSMTGHAIPETPSPGMRTRTRNQLEAGMEMGW